jgi:nucleoside-diphosphate-sugar epimerase
MHILVTGATGGLGRNAVEYLLSQGTSVVATGRNIVAGAQLTALGAAFVPMDLTRTTSKGQAALLDRVDAVWHCAALSAPWAPRQLFEASNVVATEQLLEAAGKAGVRTFVHVSTPALYFDFTHRYDVRESFQAKRPSSEYARTKALGEEMVRAASKRFPGMRTAILRPRAIFGPHDQVLVPRLRKLLAERNGRLPLPRGGRAVIDMTYVENVVQAMWLATQKGDVPSGSVFNVTNGQPTSIAAVLETLFVRELQLAMRVVDIPYCVAAVGARALEWRARFSGKEPLLTRYSAGVLAFDMTLNIEQARTVLGYQPLISLDEGVRRTAAWLRNDG